MKNFGEQFLHRDDGKLHISKPVEHEKARKDRAGQETSQKPVEKISDWLEVIERTHVSHEDRPEVLERVKEYYRKEHVIKPEDVPESTFLLEQTIARQQGHGTVEITEEFREQKIKEIIGNQETSLDKWVNYLSSSNAEYPMWAKYWAFNSMLKMGKFEKKEDKETGKEIGKFIKRDKDTVAPFPPLNPRALAMAISVITLKAEENSKSKKERNNIENTSVKLNDDEFKDLLTTESFSKIYTQFLIEMPEYSTEGLRETRGDWVKYIQGSNPDKLVKSLDGYPLEWCTANIDTAETQLQGGDFHIYYSINKSGEAKIPRVAIRMQENSIAEVRGIAPDQNLDPYISDVVKEKMGEFPDGKQYEQKSSDMKRLTEIEDKIKGNEQLTQNELIFLYEISAPIRGFGNETDPRIEEIRSKRDMETDLTILFECSKEQVALSPDQIDNNTKVYVGSLFEGIFDKNIENIFTSFPHRKITQFTIEIGGKSKKELIGDLKEDFIIQDEAKKMIEDNLFSLPFSNTSNLSVSKTPQQIHCVKVSVGDLSHDFYSGGASMEEIYKRAEELGLNLTPPEMILYPQLVMEKIQPFAYRETFGGGSYDSKSIKIAMKI